MFVTTVLKCFAHDEGIAPETRTSLTFCMSIVHCIYFRSVHKKLPIFLFQVGVMLKPFLPQLQTTFLKALNDPNRAVRLKAASALGKLIVIHTRFDPLFTELHTGIKGAEDTSVRYIHIDHY